MGRLPSRNLCYQASSYTQQLGWEGSYQGTSATRQPVIHSSWGGRLPSRNLCYQASSYTQQLGWEGSYQGTSATRQPVIHSSWGGKAPIKEPLLPCIQLYTAVGVGRLPSRNLCYQAAGCTQQLGWEGSHQGTSATRQLVIHSSWGGKAPIKEPLPSSYHKQ